MVKPVVLRKLIVAAFIFTAFTLFFLLFHLDVNDYRQYLSISAALNIVNVFVIAFTTIVQYVFLFEKDDWKPVAHIHQIMSLLSVAISLILVSSSIVLITLNMVSEEKYYRDLSHHYDTLKNLSKKCPEFYKNSDGSADLLMKGEKIEGALDDEVALNRNYAISLIIETTQDAQDTQIASQDNDDAREAFKEAKLQENFAKPPENPNVPAIAKNPLYDTLNAVNNPFTKKMQSNGVIAVPPPNPDKAVKRDDPHYDTMQGVKKDPFHGSSKSGSESKTESKSKTEDEQSKEEPSVKATSVQRNHR